MESKLFISRWRITLTKSVLNTVPMYYMQTNLLPNSTCERIDKMSRDFIWGYSDEGKGTHLIAWDKLCRPKNEGGVGLRKAKFMNHSHLMKVGQGLISRKDSLWARTLKSKYGYKMNVFSKVSYRNNNSNLWLGVCKVWNRVLENTKWRILNGKKANFWNDCWCRPSLFQRDAVVKPQNTSDLMETINDFVLPNGEWNREKLRMLLPENICNDICRSNISTSELADNTIV